MNLNKVFLIGRVRREPVNKVTPGGVTVLVFHLTTTNDINGEREFHKVVALGALGESCVASVHKGQLVYVEGRIKSSDWQDRDGDKRRSIEIIANTVKIFDLSKVEEIEETESEPFNPPRKK